MEPIYPLTEQNLDQFRGQLVCVVMQDGTRHVGVLSRCRGGRLILNDDAGGGYGADQQAEASAKRRSRRRAASRKRGGKAAGAAHPEAAYAAGFGGEWGGPPEFGGRWAGPPPYGPYGFFGPRLALDLALIALVLLIL